MVAEVLRKSVSHVIGIVDCSTLALVNPSGVARDTALPMLVIMIPHLGGRQRIVEFVTGGDCAAKPIGRYVAISIEIPEKDSVPLENIVSRLDS